jgi:catecholate siderophore receptor
MKSKRQPIAPKGKHRSPKRKPKYWVISVTAMGMLVACSAGKSHALTLRRVPPQSSASVAQNQQTRRFDIPPGTLGEVLIVFQKITGLRVEVQDEKMRELASPGASGNYNNEQALKQILAGTGISYHFIAAAAVKLEIQAESQVVQVIDVGALQVTSPKYTEPLRDTPQSITVVSQQVMQAQGVTTLRDTVRNVAGISLAAGEGGFQGDSLTIRGFTARNDIFLDAMRDFGSYYRDPFNLEEVEVLKGPSSVTFGRGTTGGVVNQDSKTPQLHSFLNGSAIFGTDLTKRITLDLNKPISGFGKGAAFRLNIMGNDSNVAERDVAENRRVGFAPSLSFGLGTQNRLTLSYFHLSANDTPDYGIPWLFDAPAPVNRSNYYGFSDGSNFLRTRADIGTFKVEHDFNSALTLRNQLRYAHYSRDAVITEARVPAGVTPSTPLALINVTRNQIAADSVETFLQNQTDFSARFRTGSITHAVVGGIEIGRETSDPTRFAYTGVPATSLLNPNPDQPFAGTSTVSSRVKTAATSFAAYILDTVKFGDRWELIGGLRWDRFKASFQQFVAPVTSFQRTDKMLSGRAAVVYKPRQNGSIYFAYGTSFNPSAESLSLTAGSANAPPEKNKTYEFGTKWDLLARRLSLRSSIFRTDKTNARETSPTNPLLVVLSGNHRVDGLELEANGRITDRWQVLASYALLDSKVVSSLFFPGAVGAELANVPKNTLSFWSNYQLPWRKLSIGGGGQFIDSRTASSTVPRDPVTGKVKQVASYWVFNAVVSYPLGERADLQVNLNNLTNRYYYDQLHPGHIVPGPGRSALVGLNFKF